ncbi:EAL domain-containing protein [Bradyrhizobium sp. LVM 105]|nr:MULTISPECIES: EAL domain-containing protein [Bradyrhizobium]
MPKHLLSAGFVETLRRTVLTARISARQIVVEVTERDELDDLAHAATVVELRDHGSRLAIDDVGVGHSGLSPSPRMRRPRRSSKCWSRSPGIFG